MSSRTLKAFGKRPSSPHLARVLLAIGVLLFCTAPTPGDVGGCSQPADSLDARVFFVNKDYIDCQRCNDCGFESEVCDRACNSPVSQSSFAEDCDPLVHDGEVCLRKLLDTDCDEYEAYVRDQNQEIPTECDFCPSR